MHTCTQAHIEDLTRKALAADGGTAVPADTVSDTVDIYLARIERDTGTTIDRSAIDPQDVARAVEAAAVCLRSLETADHL